MPPSDSPEDDYLLGHSETEQQRLRRQPRELEPDSRRLLDQIDIPSGGRVLDVGCGPQGILDLLSERVGPAGSVVGLDRGAPSVKLAREFVASHGLTNVEVVEGDAKATGLPRSSFDLVHARLVLVNVPQPERVVEEMAALARPGGVVASHESDWGGWMCDPPAPAWKPLFEALDAHARAEGVDLRVGRSTHRLLRSAGLVDVHVEPVMHACSHRHPRRLLFWNFFRGLRPKILAHGAISAEEFDARMADLKRDLADPGRLSYHLYFLTWGRKPDGQGAPSR